MTIEDPQQVNFLSELFTRSEGDTARQVSMYEIGEALGLDKLNAGALAEELIFEGFAELVSLSGGISITARGLMELNVAPEESPENNVYRLGVEKELNEEGRRAVEDILMEIRRCVYGKGSAYEDIEGIVFDIKTAEIQLLSRRTKTIIIREILKSLQEAMAAAGNAEIASRIALLITN